MTTREYLLKLSKEKLIDVMFESLSIMQSYNNRSAWDAIHAALGGKQDEEGYFQLPESSEEVEG